MLWLGNIVQVSLPFRQTHPISVMLYQLRLQDLWVHG